VQSRIVAKPLVSSDLGQGLEPLLRSNQLFASSQLVPTKNTNKRSISHRRHRSEHLYGQACGALVLRPRASKGVSAVIRHANRDRIGNHLGSQLRSREFVHAHRNAASDADHPERRRAGRSDDPSDPTKPDHPRGCGEEGPVGPKGPMDHPLNGEFGKKRDASGPDYRVPTERHEEDRCGQTVSVQKERENRENGCGGREIDK
jgi:hypothetical protein